MLKINDILEITTDSKGKCQYDGKQLHILNALPKERLQIKITKISSRFIEAKIIKIIDPSKHRSKEKCPIYDECGGCALLHMKYEEQLAYKKAELTKITSLKLHDVVPSPEMYHYRNKIILGFRQQGKQVIAGLYEEETHRIVSYEKCLLHDETSDKIVNTLCKLIMKYKLSIYDEDKRIGLFRHVMIRKGYYTKQYMVVLVVSSSIFPSRNNFIKDLRHEHPQITTIVQNVNKRATSIVLQDEQKVLYGKGFIEDQILGKTFKISPRSFFQINVLQAENLYAKAISLLRLTKDEVVLDAYCGTGTIGICAASYAKEVIGVEQNKQAVHDAIDNAKLNQINNISFYCADATDFMQMCAKQQVLINAIIMDPAREGSTYKFIEAIANLKVKKIVYISCNPETQIRDLKWFKQQGYEFKEMFLFDMFSHSKHLESIVYLHKKGI